MYAIEELIQKLRSIPEHVRTPHISNKELEQMVQNMLLVNECKTINRIGIR